jgi:DUF1365 family protein
MLGHVRTWGWLFNPLTLYYCFDQSGREVEWTVLEVSNTPWHERHAYVVGPPGEHRFAKAMHVSPFLAPQGMYTLRYTPPDEKLRVSLDVDAQPAPGPYRRDHEPTPDTAPQLAASMLLQRRPLDRAGLAHLLWAAPLRTHRVSGRIYAEAGRLMARHTPIHRHPVPAERATAVMCGDTEGRAEVARARAGLR